MGVEGRTLDYGIRGSDWKHATLSAMSTVTREHWKGILEHHRNPNKDLGDCFVQEYEANSWRSTVQLWEWTDTQEATCASESN